MSQKGFGISKIGPRNKKRPLRIILPSWSPDISYTPPLSWINAGSVWIPRPGNFCSREIDGFWP